MKNSIKLIACLLIAGMCASCTGKLPSDMRNRISLEGQWGMLLDTADVGFSIAQLSNSGMDSLFLPGTTDIGKKGKYNPDMTQTNALSREFIFEGKALYTKVVEIPENWRGSSVRLFMERTKPTTIWIDGKEVGTNDNISTAQQ